MNIIIIKYNIFIPNIGMLLEKEKNLTRKRFLILGLLAVFMLSACTPTASAPAPTSDSGVEPTAGPVQEEAPAAAPAATEAPAESEPAAVEPMGVPTSRGSQLVATDPNTVNLASGEPQLIEFFAFW